MTGSTRASGTPNRRLLLIGIGAGDPEHVTAQAARAITELNVLFVVNKEREVDELVAARTAVMDRYRGPGPYRTVRLQDPARPWSKAPNYAAAVGRWREERTAQWEAALLEHLGAGETGGFLVWGDPSLYESTLAIVDEILARGRVTFEHEVIPGVSSVHALTARHRIALNRQGRAVQIMPARLLQDGLPEGVDDVVVMLDPKQTFASIDPSGIEIYWGAYLGTPDELLIAGPLAEVREEIVRVRADAKARKGWMFDTYLLRRFLPS